MEYRDIGLFISVIILFVSGLFLFRWIYGTGNDIVGIASICGTIMSVSALFVLVTKEDIQSVAELTGTIAGSTGEATGRAVAGLALGFGRTIGETQGYQLAVKEVVKVATNGTLITAGVGSLALLAASAGATAFAGGGSLATAFAASLVAVTGSPIAVICVFGLIILSSYTSIVDAVSAELSPGELMFGNHGTMEQMDEGGRRKRRGKKSRR